MLIQKGEKKNWCFLQSRLQKIPFDIKRSPTDSALVIITTIAPHARSSKRCLQALGSHEVPVLKKIPPENEDDFRQWH